jgi:tetratricopeptide (TPR) repeat protein
MLKYLGLVVLLVTAAAAAAAQASPKPTDPKADYSKEAYVDEDDLTKISFENDGTGTREASFRLRIQSDAGVQRYSVLTFAYQEAIESIEVVYVRVRKPDGTVIVTPAENILDMPSDITRQAPFYSDLHEKHVAVKGLTVGDVLETQIRWRVTKPLVPSQFWYSFNYSRDFIQLHEEFQISVPRERAVKWKSPALKPVITEEGGRRIFTWTRSQLEHQSADQDKIEQEEKTYQAARGKLPPPDIQLSSFQNWEEIGAWYGGLQQERVKPSPEIRAKAAQLTKNAADDNAKLHAIYNYVSTQFRYIGVAFGIGRYQPHSAVDVLSNQYGDCKDKHTLLASLLDAAGIKAYPALINSSHDLDPDVPSPQQFDHVITAVPQGKDFLWLDTTAEVAPFGYLVSVLRNKQALVMPTDQPPRLITTPADLPFKPLRTFTIVAKLDDSGTLEGKVEQSIQGQDADVLLRKAFRSTPAQQWKDLAQQFSYNTGFAGDVSDVVVSQPEKTDEPWHLSYNYKRKDYPDWANHHLSPPLPPIAWPAYRDDDTKPRVPLWLGQASELDFRSQVELPKGYTPVLPTAVNLNEDFAEYHATYGIKDGKLTTERRLITKLPEIPISEYDHYKKFRKAMEDDHNAYVETSTGGPRSQPAGMAALLEKIRNLPSSTNSAAITAENDARSALQRGDLQGAIAAFEHAVELDSKFTRDWLMLGNLQMAFHNSDAGLEAFRKSVDSDPKQTVAQGILGMALMNAKRYEEAANTWEEYVKMAPEDSSGFVSEGSAYLQLGRDSDAKASFQKALELDPRPELFNDISYSMVELDKQLPLALEYAKTAVRKEEEASAKVNLTSLQTEDLAHASALAAFWDTLGWAQARLSNLDEAEKYLIAAWRLSHNGVMAEHLGHIYERLHKKELAIHMYRLALTASPSVSNVTSFMTEVQAAITHLGGSYDMLSEEAKELRESNIIKLPRFMPGTESADFFVMFAPDSKPPGFKIESVRFISGSEKMKSAGHVLSPSVFKVAFPDKGPTRLLRRGILGCYQYTGCSFALTSPDDMHSVN